MPTETRTKITYDSASIHSSPTKVTVASRTGNTRPCGLNFGAPPGESPTQWQRRSESESASPRRESSFGAHDSGT